ncbi:MAG TPA: hypothetical protein VJ861_12730 [Treponemataceae bacterium]|nr:hypothetical protein [Treponemataceae bacterium]
MNVKKEIHETTGEKLYNKVERALATNKKTLIIDCHSFSSVPLLYEPNKKPSRPDICIGADLFYTPVCLTIAFVNALATASFSFPSKIIAIHIYFPLFLIFCILKYRFA